MALSVKQIDELIAECDERLAKAKQKIVDLQTELKVLHSVRNAAQGDKPDAGRRRGASFAWRKILQFIGERGDSGASISEIFEFVRKEGLDIEDGAVRSQLSGYAKNGIVGRPPDEKGQYRLTLEGQKFIGDQDA